MAICAYCSEDRKPTGEHLIPAWMYKAAPEFTMRYIRGVDKCVNTEFEIKDVCAECNRDRLGPLDSYVKDLWEIYFSTYVRHGETVEFRYDYYLLSRWLLKVSYNHARASKDPDCETLSQSAPYMLGMGWPPLGMVVALRLIIPHAVSPQETAKLSQSERNILIDGGIPPTLVRVDHADPPSLLPDLSVCRRIVIMSYEFWVLVPHTFEAKLEMSREINAARDFHTREGMVFLYPKRRSMKVPASDTTSLDIMRSFVGAHPDLRLPPQTGARKLKKNR